MRSRSVPIPLLALGALLVVLAGCAPAPAVDLVRGGQLYDKWWEVLKVDVPEGDHPLWSTQSTNTRSGGDTWRCKECHGWDYKGVDGAYGSGSHMTGFIGVMGMAGKNTSDVLGTLKGSPNPDHDFSAYMDDQALNDLAAFMSGSLIDVAQLINDDKSPLNGDASAGAAHFELCATCHGFEGTAINFGDEAEPEYLGTVAADNPWEFVHKVRFGQPGEPMPAGISMGREQQEYADLLAYVQPLPTQSLVSEGGRLYDKWWEAIGEEVPEGDHPLWSTQSTNTRSGGDTWRCKECHGWDYKGADGVYGSGSHATGFVGVFEAREMSAADLTAWLTGGMNADHDFSPYLGEAQIEMLVAFIQSGVVDTSAYINSDGTVNGDPDVGKTAYSNKCGRCHGADGKEINFGDEEEPEYIGTVAFENPWEAFHKASSGQPGTHMPSGRNFGWTLQDIADLVAYLQTLPAE